MFVFFYRHGDNPVLPLLTHPSPTRRSSYLFVQAAWSGGYKSHYGPGACVKRIVRPHQVGIYPVLQRYLRIGRAMALRSSGPFDPNGARILGYPRYLYRTLPRDVLRALRYWASGDSFAAADQQIGRAHV